MRNGNLQVNHGRYYLRIYISGRRVALPLGREEEYETRKQLEDEARGLIARYSMAGQNRTMTLAEFIEHRYLPNQKELRRQSTYAGYADLFRIHIKPSREADRRLWEFRTSDVQRLLAEIAARRALSVTTLKHVKAFLSGAFREAVGEGMIDVNPVHEARLPARSLPPKDTVAYDLPTILSVLEELRAEPEVRAAVAIAAFAGLRRAELQGLRWQDIDEDSITVRQTVWGEYENPPKSRASASWVPMIEPLAEIVGSYRKPRKRTALYGSADPDTRIFRRSLGHLGREIVAPAFKRAGSTFHGWHAFRRGLASNLFALGCNDLIVQKILRHATVTVTRESYIKVRNPGVEAAMRKFSRAVRSGRRTGGVRKKRAAQVTEK